MSTVTDTYRIFSSFQIKIENKFLPIVLNALKQQVNAFIAAGMPESKIDQIGVASALIPIINNLYYQCGYGYGWSVYRSFASIKSLSNFDTKGNTTTITPADIAQEVVSALRYSLLVNVHGIETTLKERILQIIQQGKDNGDGYEVTARNVEGSADIVRARRIVRTESVKGSNLAGMLGAKRTGLLMDKQWISARDNRVRGNPVGKYPNAEFDHWAVNGERVPIDGKYIGTGETMMYPGDPNGAAADIINCFPENTLVEGQIISGQRLKYAGKMIEIVTVSGKRLSVTPNHPVFTIKGAVKAQFLDDSDYVISNIKEGNNIGTLGDYYVQKKPVEAANIFSSIRKLGFSEQVMVVGLDFDGDGYFGNGNIDIVNMNRELQFSNEIPIKDFGKINLESTGLERVFVRRFCPQFEFADTSFNTDSRLMCSSNLSIPFIDTHLRPFKFFSIGTSTNWNVSRFNKFGECGAADASFVRKLFHGNAGHVIIDKIVEIRNYDFVGHVYDFSTLTGAILLNNIYNSNCRCTQGFIPRRDSNGRLIRIAPGFFSNAGALSIEKSNKIFIMKKEINSNQFPSMYTSLGIDLSKLGCIMLDIDGGLVENVINKDDLYFSDNPNRYWIKGFVAGHTPHVTLLYGLLKSGNTEYRPYVDEVLKGWNYDDVKIDHIDYFDSPYADDPYYCLIAHLEISKNLLDANQRLQLLPHINTYPTYKAHITIAYIKKDEALRNELIGKYEEMLSGKKMKAIALNYGK